VTKWSDCSVVKICYADVHLLRSLQKIIRGNVGYVAMVMRDVDLQEHIHPARHGVLSFVETKSTVGAD